MQLQWTSMSSLLSISLASKSLRGMAMQHLLHEITISDARSKVGFEVSIADLTSFCGMNAEYLRKHTKSLIINVKVEVVSDLVRTADISRLICECHGLESLRLVQRFFLQKRVLTFLGQQLA